MGLGEKASPTEVLEVIKKRRTGRFGKKKDRKYYVTLRGRGHQEEMQVSETTYRSLKKKNYLSKPAARGLRLTK